MDFFGPVFALTRCMQFCTNARPASWPASERTFNSERKSSKKVKLQLQADWLDECAIKSSVQTGHAKHTTPQIPFQRMCARALPLFMCMKQSARVAMALAKERWERKAMHLPSSSSTARPFARHVCEHISRTQSRLAYISIASRRSDGPEDWRAAAAGKARLHDKKVCVSLSCIFFPPIHIEYNNTHSKQFLRWKVFFFALRFICTRNLIPFVRNGNYKFRFCVCVCLNASIYFLRLLLLLLLLFFFNCAWINCTCIFHHNSFFFSFISHFIKLQLILL